MFCFSEYNSPCIAIQFIWCNVSFNVTVSSLILCLDDLSNGVSVAWNSFYYCCITVSFSLHVCEHLFCVFWCSSVGCVDIYNCHIFSFFSLNQYIMSLSLLTVFVLTSFLWYNYYFTNPFLFLFTWNISFHPGILLNIFRLVLSSISGSVFSFSIPLGVLTLLVHVWNPLSSFLCIS